MRFAVAGAVLGGAQVFLLPALAGLPMAANLADWPNLIVMLVLVPLIIGWYAWQPHAILDLYRSLLTRVAPRRDRGANFSANLIAPHRARAVVWPALVLTSVVTILLAARLVTQADTSWENASLALVLTRLAIRFITFYALMMYLVRQMTVTVALNRFFGKTAVTLNPLHPDRAGGLKAMGNFALSSAGLVMVVGLLLSLQYIDARWNGAPLGLDFPVEVLTYALAGPAVFFLPLLQAHRQMVAARNNLLEEVAGEFGRIYQELQARLANNQEAVETLAQMEAVEELYAVAAEAPSWPFNLGILSRFGGLIALPIVLPAAVDVVANLLTR